MRCRRIMLILEKRMCRGSGCCCYDLLLVVTSSRSPITDCVLPTTVLFLAGQSRIVHICRPLPYIYIYACAGTEERKTRSWPLRAVRLLKPTVGVSGLVLALANPRFLPTTGSPELAASFSATPLRWYSDSIPPPTRGSASGNGGGAA